MSRVPLNTDPFLINLHGIKVQVPKERVKELLAKGFRLADKQWNEKIESPETIETDLKVEEV